MNMPTTPPNAPPTPTLERLGRHAYARIAGGQPNSGFIVGREGVIVVDAAPTPALARAQLQSIRSVTAAPIRYVLLTHYHAVRVLGAGIYLDEGAQIVASNATRDLIEERGQADMVSEMTRFAKLFPEPESVRGLVWPTVTFESEMRVSLGDVEVHLLHLGPGHTAGDAIAWLPEERVCFAGDLVEMRVGVYAGDAHMASWLQSLEKLLALQPTALVPGRGSALRTPDEVQRAVQFTAGWVGEALQAAQDAVAQGLDFRQAYDLTRSRMDARYGDVFLYEHCIAYSVARALDECRGLPPAIWELERDVQMRRDFPGIA